MLSDVIAAAATVVGQSAVALIRVSGDRAFAVCRQVIEPFAAEPLRTLRRAQVRHPDSGEVLDDVLYSVFAAPRSYTGQDLVEISTHGGVLIPTEVLGALYRAGARAAARGEFTRRAVLNHKMDLLQAEAVGDLIAATAPAQRRMAMFQLDRGLSRRIEGLRERVLALESLICYEIDFPEEDSGPVSDARVRSAIGAVEADFEALLSSSGQGERLREGAVVVVAGRPNAGKSSLFNALVGADRAIVTDTPGTTRDAIEAPVTCDGMPFRLVDTAGLRPTGDRIEQLGIEVSRKYLAAADLVLFCAAADEDLHQEDRFFLEEIGAPTLLVRTKCDLVAGPCPAPGLPVSALEGTGMPVLRAAMVDRAFGAIAGADAEPILTRERHRAALAAALAEIRAFRTARASGLEGAVAAVHLRSAVAALEDVIGVVTHDDVLDVVFRTFCIGK